MIKKLPGGKLYTNSYIIADDITKEAAVIDPVGDFEDIRKFIDKNGLEVKFALLTHGHGDHIGALMDVKEHYNAQIGINPEDEDLLSNAEMNMSPYLADKKIETKADIYLRDKDVLKLGEQDVLILHTPGHTKGSICILFENELISGDTLFARGIGRTDLYGGNYDALMDSIKTKLFTLPADTNIHPGHGSSSTIKDEIENNPFF